MTPSTTDEAVFRHTIDSILRLSRGIAAYRRARRMGSRTRYAMEWRGELVTLVQAEVELEAHVASRSRQLGRTPELAGLEAEVQLLPIHQSYRRRCFSDEERAADPVEEPRCYSTALWGGNRYHERERQ